MFCVIILQISHNVPPKSNYKIVGIITRVLFYNKSQSVHFQKLVENWHFHGTDEDFLATLQLATVLPTHSEIEGIWILES